MDILDGFAFVFQHPTALVWVALAALIGVIVGALPGLTAPTAIALLMPVTFYLDPLAALAFLYVIGKSGRFGGSISAILFNTPGTTASAATMLDGNPLTRQGKSGKALKMAALASVFGDTTGELLLIFGAAAIATLTATFGPPEFFSIYLMAFVIIGSVVGKSVVKGLLSTLFGALVSLIGLDPISAEPRLTMGLLELESGFSLVPLLIGIFVMSEIMFNAEETLAGHVRKFIMVDSKDRDSNRVTWAEFKRCLPVMIRSSALGSMIGIVPGLGSPVACFVAYSEEKRRSPNRQAWGTGVLEGVAAPESANNAVSGPSMIPLLTLGVPGSTIAAILIGVFLIHGIQVGPTIFQTAHDLVFGLFACGLVGIALYGLIGYYGGPLIGRLVAMLSPRIIYPFIFITAFVAAYSARASAADVVIMLIFGVIGYIMRKFDFAPAAFIIAFVLAKGAEESYRQSLLLSDSGNGIFLDRPIALAFMALGLFVVIWRSITTLRTDPESR
jgi:putative tricarboxylic transport membrane protein